MASRGSPEQNPTLRGRRLAMELLRRREATGMSREEVARQLEWSTSTLFRIETGRSRPQPGNVRTLLELYGVTGAERDGLIQLTREARQPGWWHSFRDVLPNPYEVYIGLEAGAASIRNFEPVVVPGLLQTADYAREIFRNGPIELDPEEIQRLRGSPGGPAAGSGARGPAAAVGGDRRGGDPSRGRRGQRDARAAPASGRVSHSRVRPRSRSCRTVRARTPGRSARSSSWTSLRPPIRPWCTWRRWLVTSISRRVRTWPLYDCI